MTLFVFFAVFGLYLSGASPSIAPRDAADMAGAAWTLGVAHPPGYPLYAVLGRAWLAAFPFGNPAYRLAVLSALAAAGAVSLLFGAIRRRSGVWGALAAAAVWAFSAPLWKFALVQEKYALHALFAVALLALTEGAKDSLWRRARLSGFLVGLGLVNHQSLLLWLPGLLWLWHRECSRQGALFVRALGAGAPWTVAGLSLYAFLWIRLGALGPALATALRAQYGTGTLFTGLARPLTPERALKLLAWSLKTWAEVVSLPVAAAAAVGWFWAWRKDRERALGLLIGAAGAGPLFVVLSRFDLSSWIARSVLEPAFLLPALVAAVFAGEAVGRLDAIRTSSAASVPGPKGPGLGPRAPWACGFLAIGALALRAPIPERRDDFLAYDYARNLRRAVPPGGALLAGGDSALFGLRWLALTAPQAPAREIAGAGLTDRRAWLTARTGRSDVFVSGIGLADLKGLGLVGGARSLAPEGLVQRVGAGRAAAPIILRRPRAWLRDESYARDAKLSYAYAFWASARLLEAQGLVPPEVLDLAAVSLDPEDYQLE